MKWLKDFSIESIIKVIAMLVAIIGFALMLDFRVKDVEATQDKHINDYERYRYQTVPETYMRKDVAEQVMIRLERIERKIDNMNRD